MFAGNYVNTKTLDADCGKEMELFLGKEDVIEIGTLYECITLTLKEPRDSCSTLIRMSLGGVPGRAEVLFRATARLSPCPSPANTSTKK